MFKTKLILVATLLAGVSGEAMAQSRPVGVNAAVRNRVTMRSGAATTYHAAALKERVGLGDDIRTAANSVLQILLLDRTTFTVGANAQVKIDRFVYDPDRRSSAVGASVARGAFRFMSGKATRGAPGQSSIRTPVGSIGIRGTILEGVVGADAIRIARAEPAVGNIGTVSQNATLIVLRGPGAATQGDEKPGAIDVTLDGTTVAIERPGLALFVPGPGATPIGPFAISDAGLDALHDLLRTEPTRRRSAAIDIEGSPVVDMTFECEGSFDVVQSPLDPANPTAGVSSSSGGCSVSSRVP